MTTKLFKYLILPLAILAFALVFNYNNGKLKEKIAILEGKNMELTRQNAQLEQERITLMDSIAFIDARIAHLEDIQQQLNQENSKLNKKITQIQAKYEKALHHADNFNADSIQVYFSNLQFDH